MFRLVCLLVVASCVRAIDKACPFKPLDIIFCIDGSGSEGQTNFNKQLQFLQNFTSQFEIGENNTRVSLITFATSAHSEFFLNQYQNKTQLLDRIGETKYPNGETNTHTALNLIRGSTLSSRHDGDRNVSKIVIVLTDGRSTEPETLQRSATQLKNNPLVTVVAIGIGRNVDPKELDMIATDANHTFQVSSFDALHSIETDLTDATCQACKNVYTDICFVLDSSGSEGPSNFHKQLEFVNMVVNEFQVDSDGYVRVCVATFDTSSRMEIRLSAYDSKEALMENILKIQYRDGETMTNLGMDRARRQLNSRQDATKIMIVLTDGRSTEPSFTQHTSEVVHRNGIDTYAIGIGSHVDPNELKIIASDQDHVYSVRNFDDLDGLHQELVDSICSTAKQYVETTTTTTTTTTLPSTTTKAACGLKPADIVFVLDSSDSEGPEHFKQELDFVYSFAAQFSIGVTNQQFSVVTFSSDVRNEFFFNKYNSRNDVLHAIRNIEYMGQGTNTSGALNFVRTESLDPANGARTNSSKFVIVITDGRSDLPDETQKEATLLHSKAEVISLGIGPKVDRGELSAIASNHRVLQVDSFALLNTIQNQLTELACEN